MKPEYLSQSRVKSEFGLTDTQIRSLGEPDTTRPNPHYRKGPPMKLYLRKRVEEWIAEHQREITASQPRKQAAHTKRESAPRRHKVMRSRVDTAQVARLGKKPPSLQGARSVTSMASTRPGSPIPKRV